MNTDTARRHARMKGAGIYDPRVSLTNATLRETARDVADKYALDWDEYAKMLMDEVRFGWEKARERGGFKELTSGKTCVRTADGKVECGTRVRGFGEGDDDEPDPNAEPYEPDESDLTTKDDQHFYQDGKLVLTVDRDATEAEMWRAIKDHMDKAQFWPNVWVLSDHGNWEQMRSPRERSREGLRRATKRSRYLRSQRKA